MIALHVIRWAVAVVAAAIVCCTTVTADSATEEKSVYDQALATAHQLDDSSEGQAYEKEFFAAIGSQIQRALGECTDSDTPEHGFRLLFEIEGGKVARVLPEPEQPVAACVAAKLTGIPAPSPPEQKWIVSLRMTVTR